MTRRFATLALVAFAAWGSTACMAVSGRMRGEEGPVPDWSLQPNRCESSNGALDFFFRGPDALDTEIVVKATPGLSVDLAVPLTGEAASLVPQQSVLVRVPNQSKMVVLRRSDCSVFDLRLDQTYSAIGRVTLDCRRPEIGHVTGTLEFVCGY